MWEAGAGISLSWAHLSFPRVPPVKSPACSLSHSHAFLACPWATTDRTDEDGPGLIFSPSQLDWTDFWVRSSSSKGPSFLHQFEARLSSPSVPPSLLPFSHFHGFEIRLSYTRSRTLSGLLDTDTNRHFLGLPLFRRVAQPAPALHNVPLPFGTFYSWPAHSHAPPRGSSKKKKQRTGGQKKKQTKARKLRDVFHLLSFFNPRNPPILGDYHTATLFRHLAFTTGDFSFLWSTVRRSAHHFPLIPRKETCLWMALNLRV
jgi:hypothetical protein